MESSLPGEQEQSHSAGTDIPVVVYGRWYSIIKVNNIHEKISLWIWLARKDNAKRKKYNANLSENKKLWLG